MSAAPRITQRDIAEACGVHPSTICLALKNSPSIPLATRRKVQTVAGEMGYQLNVAARNLALLRGDRSGGGGLPIAWLNQENDRHHWQTDPVARGIYEAAQRRAATLGYHLEEIWTREPGMKPGRLLQIIRARGIQGALFPVHREFDEGLVSPAWSELALVGLNDRRLADWMDVVCPDYHRNAVRALTEVRRLDAGRVGLTMTESFAAMSDGLVHGSFLQFQASLATAERIPLCLLPDRLSGQEMVMVEWLQRQRPEVVLCDRDSMVRCALAAGVEAVWLGLTSAEPPFDGGLQGGLAEIAGAAVECVVDKMRHFQHGLSEASQVHSLKCGWVAPRVLAHNPMCA